MTIFEKMENQRSHGFGTGPVFFTAISTILGAILFLRFGFAVGSLGFMGVMAIILLGPLQFIRQIRNNPDSGVYAGLYCFITNSVFDNNGDAVGEAGVRVFEGCRVDPVGH